MAEELAELTEAIEAFAIALSEERYYDAHEALERIWYPRRFEEEDEVRLCKGFINAAVSFELLKRGRFKPSEVAWATYLKYCPLLERVVTPRKELYVKIAQAIDLKKKELHV